MRLPAPWYRKDKQAYYVQFNGKQIRLGKTKAEASRRYRDLLQERGLNPDNHQETAHAIVDKYLEWGNQNLAPSTMETRRLLAASFRSFIAPGMRAVDVKPYQVEQWASGKKGLSPTTINSRMTMIGGIWSWAFRQGLISINPLIHMRKPSPMIREEFVSVEMLPKILGAAKSQQARDLINFLADTGARATEVFKFTAAHYEKKNKRLSLPIVDSKGRRRRRVVYLGPVSVEIVERLISEHPAGKIFRSPSGSAWHKDSARQMFKKIANDLGLDSLCATQFRHGFAHHRISQGQDIALVAKLMGHADTNQIYKRYGHLAEGSILSTAVQAVPSMAEAASE